MNVLISIKPKYVEKIVAGTKKYEFRRSVFKKDVENIYIYESAPRQKIIGYFPFSGIIYDTIENLWKTCGASGGITKEDFYAYFRYKERGYAIIIDKLKVLEQPINPFDIIPGFTPPQSFMYINI